MHLLPNYDEYVVAYQDRSALFATEAMAREFSGMGALSSAAVLYRGQIAGQWHRSLVSGRVVLTVSLRRDLGQAGQRALSAAASRYGRFLGLPVELRSGGMDP